jgi:hypothetical protein
MLQYNKSTQNPQHIKAKIKVVKGFEDKTHIQATIFKAKVRVLLQPTVRRVLKPPSAAKRVAGLLICGSLSDERTCLSFTTAVSLLQRSYSRV